MECGRYVTFWNGLFSLAAMPLRLLQVVSCSFYLLSNILCCAFATQVAYLIEILGLSGREPLSPSNVCPRDGKRRLTHLSIWLRWMCSYLKGNREGERISICLMPKNTVPKPCEDCRDEAREGLDLPFVS